MLMNAEKWRKINNKKICEIAENTSFPMSGGETGAKCRRPAGLNKRK